MSEVGIHLGVSAGAAPREGPLVNVLPSHWQLVIMFVHCAKFPGEIWEFQRWCCCQAVCVQRPLHGSAWGQRSREKSRVDMEFWHEGVCQDQNVPQRCEQMRSWNLESHSLSSSRASGNSPSVFSYRHHLCECQEKQTQAPDLLLHQLESSPQ